MQKIGIKYIVIFSGIVLLAVCGFLIYTSFVKEEKIVYVNNVKLFDEFIMTKEMKRVGEKEFNSRKKAVDSLFAMTQSATLPEESRKFIVQEFVQKRDELEQFGQAFASEEASKIWARIQSYAKDFAKENGYKMVIGSDEKRSVLFADESVDVTAELTNYINIKYEGLK